MSELVFEKCEAENTWDEFVKKSPQGTIFCETRFLRAAQAAFDLWFVLENKNPLCAIPILKNSTGQPITSTHYFSQYQGPLLSREIHEAAPHRKSHELLKVFNFALAELVKLYDGFFLAPHFSLDDIRAFQWLHYHEPENGKPKIDISYGGIIDLHSFTDFEAYLSAIRKSRRTDWKKAQEQKIEIKTSLDLGTFERIYRSTFERQDIQVSEKTIQIAKSIVSTSIEERFGTLSFAYVDDKVASANLFIEDQNSSYYLLGANDPQFRQSPAGSYLVLWNIREALKSKKKSVDVCGMNSPSRGDFKSSLNSEPKPFYQITWNKQK